MLSILISYEIILDNDIVGCRNDTKLNDGLFSMPQIRKVTSKNIVFDVINGSRNAEQVDLITGPYKKTKITGGLPKSTFLFGDKLIYAAAHILSH
ncbi:MAG: hypothetical protein ACJAWQ_001781 [Paraglaciecola sp.]|jgi:hypothetical protein